VIVSGLTAGRFGNDAQGVGFHDRLARRCFVEDKHGGDVEPGSSRRHAIVVSSVEEEYVWLQEHYPGHRVTSQALCLFPEGAVDVLEIESEGGEARELYFALRRFSTKD
jgi:hypothetical protein